MQLRPEQLAAHLEKPLQALYVLHGDDPLLTVEAGAGAVFFGAVVVLTILAAESFDPRLIWDACETETT